MKNPFQPACADGRVLRNKKAGARVVKPGCPLFVLPFGRAAAQTKTARGPLRR